MNVNNHKCLTIHIYTLSGLRIEILVIAREDIRDDHVTSSHGYWLQVPSSVHANLIIR